MRTGIAYDDYQAFFQAQMDAGRVPSALDAGDGFFNGVWTSEDVGAWAAVHNVSKTTLLTRMAEWSTRGLKVRLLTGYGKDGNKRYAAVATER